jgi:nitroimidazol reductase NimA-like FMN-containing flavoprotein (pyridoxamine 5'-phosphate oxidase superfamily)
VPIERRGDYIVKMYELEEDVCLRLLTGCTFGRVAFDDPRVGLTVLPVNFVMSDDAVVFRVQVGSALDTVGKGSPVAFEADHVDTVAESGWSVLVRGTATHIRGRKRVAALADTTVHPWAPGRRDRWIEIRPQLTTGRIVKRERLPGEPARVPYMPPG